MSTIHAFGLKSPARYYRPPLRIRKLGPWQRERYTDSVPLVSTTLLTYFEPGCTGTGGADTFGESEAYSRPAATVTRGRPLYGLRSTWTGTP